jgi:hypothetical protein
MCPACNADFEIYAFSAFFERKAAPDVQAMRVEEGEATCFNHAAKRAVAACSQCGRFVCALCSVELEGTAWCPSCLSGRATAGKTKPLERRRLLWDSIALGVAIWPAFLFYPALLTGPAVIFLAIRYWNAPSSIVPRTKWRFVAAILIALAELAFIVFAVVLFVIALRSGMKVQ